MFWNRKGWIGVTKNAHPLSPRKETGHSAIDTYHHSSGVMFALVFAIGAAIFVWDFNIGFARGFAHQSQVAVLYFILATLLFVDLSKANPDRKALTFWIGKRLFFAIFAPLGLIWLASFLPGSSATSFSGFSFLVDQLTKGWLPLLFIYWGGFMHYLVDQASQIKQLGKFSAIFSFINFFVFLLFIFTFMLPFVTLAAENLGGGTDEQLIADQNVWETGKSAVGDIKEAISGAITNTRTNVDSAIKSATPTYYTSTAENQQGARLGVYFSDLRPILPVFSFQTAPDPNDPEKQQLTTNPAFSSDVIWFGMLDARTFAEEMDVHINCTYTPGTKDAKPLSVAARPAIQKVFFTGQFQDSYPFDCTIPMDELLPIVNEHGINGRFSVDAEYTFDTWGYVTYTFMDREEYLSLRRQNIEPSTELGITRNARAIYTPGPMRLGLEAQQMPIPIDVQSPVNNQKVRFGITLENAWATRGKVAKIHKIILQVPMPFTIDHTECKGTNGRYVTVYSEGTSVDYDPTGINTIVPEGYNWYEWEDANIDEDQRFITFVCPLHIDDTQYSALLGPDLSPKQFTFVAQANYDYQSTQPVNVRLGVEKI